MQSLGSSCSSCRSEYNDSDRLPRIIPSCGHTLCTECLGSLIKNPSSTAKCPLDNIPFPQDKKTIESFKVNFGLKELIEEASAQEVCPIHQETLRLICYTDKKKICDDCVHFGDHKDHDVRPVKQVQPLLEEKKKSIEATIAGIDKHSRGAGQLLDEAQDNLKEAIKGRFSELQWILRNKEQIMMSQVEDFIATQKKMFSNVLGFKSQLKNDLTKVLSKYRDFTRYENIFELIEEDVKPMTSRLNVEILAEYSSNLKRNLKEVTDSFDDKLRKLNLDLSTIECPLQEILKASNSFLLLHNEKETLTETYNANTFSSNGKINLKIQDDLLEIKYNIQNSEDITISSDELKSIRKVKLLIDNFPSGGFSNTEDKILFFIWNNLEKIESFELGSCNRETNATAFQYDNFLELISWKMNSLKSLKIDFSGCERMNDDISGLIRKLLTKSIGLENLYIDLSNTEITDTTISTIAEKNLETMKSLEHLHLAFQCCDITDEATPELFVAMPNIKSFCLNLMEVELYDNTIEAFAKNSLPTMANLQSLALLLSGTQVTDSGCSQLFCNMQNVKEFALALNKTKITDMTVEVLSTVLTSMSHNLEDFVLLLEGTKVTDMGLTQICGLMENVKDFILHLNQTMITDKTIEAFSQITLASMKKLQNLRLGLSNTQITDDGAIQLFAFQQEMSSFGVNLSGTALTDNFGRLFTKALDGMKNLKNFDLNVSNTLMSMEVLSLIGNKRKELLEKFKG